MIAICFNTNGDTYRFIVDDIACVAIKHNDYFKHVIVTKIDNIVDHTIDNPNGYIFSRSSYGYPMVDDVIEIRTNDDIWFEHVD